MPIRLGGVVALVVAALMVPLAAWAKYAAIVVDAHDGRVLYENNADSAHYPASLTKMMTLYLLFESLKTHKTSMKTRLNVSAHAAAQAPTKMGLKVGATIRVDDAIKSLVVKSANDVAVVIAEYLGGTEGRFAAKMTKKARQLGMSKTTFRNASGLPNRGQISTARDMATLSMALQRDFPEFYPFFSLRSFQFSGQKISTHNRVLLKYQGADGLKTGYIRASGFNLAASANREGVRLVGVVFGGKTAAWRDERMMTLLDKGFAAERAMAPRPRRKPVLASVTPVTKPTGFKALTASHQAVPEVVRPTRLSAALTQSWGIQVGAFERFQAARDQAQAAANTVQDHSESAQPAVTSVRHNGGIMFRSRVLGLETQSEARAACRHLKAANKSCILVQPGSIDLAYVFLNENTAFTVQ